MDIEADVVPSEPEVVVPIRSEAKGILKRRSAIPRSRLLRREARAALLDAFRRYILTEISNPFPQGGYPFWILCSSLYKADARMQFLIQNAGGDLAGLCHANPRLRAPPSPTDAPFCDDDENASLTDTDGSSIHTPRDSYVDSPFLYQQINGIPEDSFVDLESGLPQNVPSRKSLSAYGQRLDARTEYAMLHASCTRLQALLSRTQETERNAASERAGQLAFLEIKSRRRAWSTKSLLGRSSADSAHLGIPNRSSPLARFAPITPETLATDACLLSVPRSGRTRLGAVRLSTISERDNDGCVPEDVESDGEDVFELHVPPFRARSHCIPFPQTGDFCSTAPHDPLPLFTSHDPYDDSALQSEEYASIYSPSPISAGDPHVVSFQVYSNDNSFDPSSQQSCDEFTLALDFRTCVHPGQRRHKSNRVEALSPPLVHYR